MNINITIFFQAIQFAIAYFFLYRYLFAPAHKILCEQELFEKKLYENVAQEQQAKKQLEQIYLQQDHLLKESLIDMIPQDATKLDSEKLDVNATLYHVEKVELTAKEKDELKDFIVDRLSQVIK